MSPEYQVLQDPLCSPVVLGAQAVLVVLEVLAQTVLHCKRLSFLVRLLAQERLQIPSGLEVQGVQGVQCSMYLRQKQNLVLLCLLLVLVYHSLVDQEARVDLAWNLLGALVLQVVQEDQGDLAGSLLQKLHLQHTGLNL